MYSKSSCHITANRRDRHVPRALFSLEDEWTAGKNNKLSYYLKKGQEVDLIPFRVERLLIVALEEVR